MADERAGIDHERRARRQLASDSRTARFARAEAWRRQRSFVGSRWWVLVLTFLVPPVASMPLALSADGVERGAIIGASVASGVWLTVVTVVVFSGSAARFAGAAAEEWTAGELRRLRRKGWRMVNGLKVRGEFDVDHVVVGPGGVLVVETKWSGDAWPLEGAHGGFMAGRLADAVRAAQRNAADVATQFRRQLGDERVQAVVVLWSPLDPPDELDRLEVDGVVVVRGAALRQWLGTLEPGHFNADGVVRIWQAVQKQARVRDARDAASGAIRLKANQLIWRWVGQPFAGFVLATYAMAGIVQTGDDGRLGVLGILLVGAACVLGLRHERLHQVALGGAVAVTTAVSIGVIAVLSG